MNFFINLFDKIIGTKNTRMIKEYQLVVDKINAFESAISSLADDELCQKTQYFKQELANGQTLEDILPEAFAVVREASKRVLNMRHFDVQLIGGMVLHDGNIAEMRTGEGKTLVSTLPAYLNALTGNGVHIVTVNDYLAGRDAHWMGQIHKFLGLTVGCIDGNISNEEKKYAYNCDITYGTNNEYGFDYLRDNLAVRKQDLTQRTPYFAIIDEVDSILIDEARTPLIISGPSDDKSDLYHVADEIIQHFTKEHYDLDEESRTVTLNDKGYDKAEQLLSEKQMIATGNDNLYDSDNLEIMHHITQALRAHHLFTKNKDYLIKNDKLILIDEFTGRMMDGRRFSDGLHQALEAKERVTIQPENQTLSSVTFQNYFRLYEKLSGMTGTADTEAAEFKESFNMHVVQIPTHLPVQRIDDEDALYMSKEHKYQAIVKEIMGASQTGRPVLVGTASIERSDELSDFLTKEKIQHQVLNARYHEQEAFIIAQAGRLNAITIATNMAGRGTDIQLGGSAEMLFEQQSTPDMSDADKKNLMNTIKAQIETEKQQVIDAGGLYVIGTERHESRRIDNQLRGRSGRQGDKGKSRFFLSLDDDLLRIFGGDRLKGLLKTVGMNEGDALEDRMLSKAIIRAQKKVEQKNYDARRQLMKYDDIVNEQRTIVFKRRRALVEGHDFTPIIHDMIEKFIAENLVHFCNEKMVSDDWDTQGLIEFLNQSLGGHDFAIAEYLSSDGINYAMFKEYLTDKFKELHEKHIASWHESIVQDIQREYVLRPLDFHWRHHLSFLDKLGKMINFRGYGQKDPLIEYKREAFENFSAFLSRWRGESLGRIMQIQVQYSLDSQDSVPSTSESLGITMSSDDDMNDMAFLSALQPIHLTNPETGELISINDYSRNAPCPCGSGRKFKYCHGHPSVVAKYNVAI